MKESAKDIEQYIYSLQTQMLTWLREAVAIPSPSGDEDAMAAWFEARLREAGADEVARDAMGNVLGRIGSGPYTVAFDTHLDTVLPAGKWLHDPYRLHVEAGLAYGLGVADMKGAAVALIAAAAALRKFSLVPDDMTVWITGTVREEECEGVAWRHIIETEQVVPHAVVIAEATGLQVARGQRGHAGIEVVFAGTPAHGAFPHEGHNPVIAAAAWLQALAAMPLPTDPFLGAATVTPSGIRSRAASTCSVPEECVVRLDRRLIIGETPGSVLGALAESLPPSARAVIPRYEFSRGEHRWEMDEFFPAWVTAEDHPLVAAAAAARACLPGITGPCDTAYGFSTNGIMTAGYYDIPTVGFGPGLERAAHTADESLSLVQLPPAALLYALLPGKCTGR